MNANNDHSTEGENRFVRKNEGGVLTIHKEKIGVKRQLKHPVTKMKMVSRKINKSKAGN